MCKSLLRFLYGQPEVPATMESLREIVKRMGQGKSDAEQCRLWYDIELIAFNELGEVYIDTWEVLPEIIQRTVTEQYLTLTDLKLPDGKYFITDMAGMQKILTRDWTNIVPYVADKSDCDKYGNRLYEHCCRYYNLNTVFPIWGMTTQGYHGFNVVVLRKDVGVYIARIIEPQMDSLFEFDGPLGHYTPDTAALKLGTKVSLQVF